MKNVLTVKNVEKVYGSRGNVYTALNGISLEVGEGEFVGVMGPSGAGKSTLLNIISTIDKPSSGIVSVDGDDITKMNEDKLSSFRRDKLGFIFQDFNLLDTLTVKENIILPLALSKVNIREIESRLKSIAQTPGIADILKKYPYEISGGQKQRAAAARAIITSPKLVLADEPTGALDSKSATELLQCLSDLNEKNNATIMMVTHDAFSASYCQRILFIKDGVLFTELVRGGSRKEFFQKIIDVLATLGGGDKNELI
ncbi:ABC transporter ATP-binding protein [Clostridium sp. UBA6640]|uniref:ABC transporter ATP-binding protein n=1 Tax=Clostridium sp. UBA6640 TaxID=1946370 RepID=UPI0025BCE127|nr:ABC transporter ATP-binding protein [Clostridium sp. UBA6640]